MSEQDKKSHWAKTLDEAGLMDPIEDAWEMPNDPQNEPISVNPKDIVPSTHPAPEIDFPADKEEKEILIPDRKGHDDTTKPVILEGSNESPGHHRQTPEDLEFDGFETLDENRNNENDDFEDASVPFAIPIPIIPLAVEPPRESYGNIDLEHETASIPPELREATISSTPPTEAARATANLFHDALSQLREAKRQRLRTDIARGELIETGSAPPEPEDEKLPLPESVSQNSESQHQPRNVSSEAPERSTPKLEYSPPGTGSFPPFHIVTEPFSGRDQVGSGSHSPKEEMQKKLDLGDYTGALEIAEKIVANSPGDQEAAQILDLSKNVLLKTYESQVGAMERCPRPAIPEEEIIWKNLDPACGFILSQIDGTITFEEILDISSMPRLETFRILSKLLEEGIIK